MKKLLPFLFIIFPLMLLAQRNMDEVKFTVDGQELSMPYAGGLNSSLFSGVDLNNDGKKDLVIFERSDDAFIGMRNEGAAGETNYVYDESLVKNFPQVKDWAYLVDYDKDGAPDLFSISPFGGGGIGIFKGKWENDRLTFTLEMNSLEAVDGFQVYTSATKMPTLADVNNDGDIDILVFEFFDSTIEYYENQSVEQGTPMDTFIVKRKSNCWGYICECSSVDNSITLDYDEGQCFHKLWDQFPGNNGGDTEPTRHAGSTLLAFDPDKDNDKDILVGDAGFPNLVYLENNPTNRDSIFRVDTNFPSYNTPVNYNIFPAPSLVDINNDDKKDLLISTYSSPVCYLNAILDTAYNANLMLYENVGSDKDTFQYRSSDFLVRDMVDIGFNTQPAFFDYNGDGLLDIVVGRCYERTADNPDSIKYGLALFENTGNTHQPAYNLVSEDFAQLRAQGLLGVSPDFADLDNDGDEDMVIGLKSGSLVYYRNTAIGNEAKFEHVPDFFENYQTVSNPNPQIVDVNEDGLLDMLIGEKQGRIFYYKNEGTKSNPSFTLVTNYFGEVDVRRGYYYGFAAPWLGDADGNGERELLVGNNNGQVIKYTDIDGNLDGVFTVADTNYLNMNWGEQVSLDAADIDGNGKLDFITGNFRGGLRLRTFGQPVGVETVSNQHPLNLNIFPNPANDQLTIRTNAATNGTITVYNLTGTALMARQHQQNGTTTLDVSKLSNGVYFVTFTNDDATYMEKVVVKR